MVPATTCHEVPFIGIKLTGCVACPSKIDCSHWTEDDWSVGNGLGWSYAYAK